jgi:hypothetical protein
VLRLAIFYGRGSWRWTDQVYCPEIGVRDPQSLNDAPRNVSDFELRPSKDVSRSISRQNLGLRTLEIQALCSYQVIDPFQRQFRLQLVSAEDAKVVVVAQKVDAIVKQRLVDVPHVNLREQIARGVSLRYATLSRRRPSVETLHEKFQNLVIDILH